MQCSRHHMETDDLGFGKCSVPMWSGQGTPAGFCDRAAYGERPECGGYTDPVGEYHRWDHRYSGHVPSLACPAHGGPDSRVYLDGNKWCAVLPDFENLMVSPCGFGDTPEEARAELARRKEAKPC